MTEEQAKNYLRSSGMSDDQIKIVANALKHGERKGCGIMELGEHMRVSIKNGYTVHVVLDEKAADCIRNNYEQGTGDSIRWMENKIGTMIYKVIKARESGKEKEGDE